MLDFMNPHQVSPDTVHPLPKAFRVGLAGAYPSRIYEIKPNVFPQWMEGTPTGALGTAASGRPVFLILARGAAGHAPSLLQPDCEGSSPTGQRDPLWCCWL